MKQDELIQQSQRQFMEIQLEIFKSQLREQEHKEAKARDEAEIARLQLEHVEKILELPDYPVPPKVRKS